MTAANGEEKGLPIAILEAIAHVLAVISTHHAGNPEAVLDGSSDFFLVAEHDEPTMARRFGDMAESATLRHELGMFSRKRVREWYSVEFELRGLRRLLINDSSI